MESYSKKQIEVLSASPHPSLVAEGERGLTPRRKKLLEETMRRHDAAFKMLADM
ncbi:MAG: hypothetical protein WA102_12845 [Candidatus Methanoperedens sp.]